MNLKQRWVNLWERLGAFGGSLEAFQLVERGYQRPGRFYHTLKHVEDCLTNLDAFGQAVGLTQKQLDLLEFALVFHDVDDSEEKSAALARETALNAGLGSNFAEQASQLIIATKHLSRDKLTYMQLTIAEIDLSILGEAEEVFDEYERNVYREYVGFKGVELERFRTARKTLLEGFRNRKPIFSLQFFWIRYEEAAKRNLERSIANLS